MGLEYDAKAKEMLRFQVKRCGTNSYKSMLTILEDIADEHDTALEKLNSMLPDEYKKYVELANYMTEDKFQSLRSKILGAGNNNIRELEQQLENFEIKFK